MLLKRNWTSVYSELGLDWESVPVAPNKNLADYVKEHAKEYTNRPALEYNSAYMSYGQLNDLANKLASIFLEEGFEAGDVIAIQMPNTPQYVVALVAASRLGMVVTSLSPLLSTNEAVAQCKDANVKLLFTLDSHYVQSKRAAFSEVSSLELVVLSKMDDFPLQTTPLNESAYLSSPHRVVVMVSACEMLREGIEIAQNRRVGTDYLQYTGGTTGKPKAAELRAMHIFTNNMQANIFYGLEVGKEVIASAFPLFHIGGVAVLFNALRTASTFLVIPDPRNIKHYCETMRVNPPTVLANVPALFQMLVEEEAFCELDFSRLRIAISGAAPFPEQGIRRLEATIGRGKYCEVYGMTETSPVQTINPAKRFRPGFVGVPVPGTDLRVVKPGTTEIVETGEAGEVIVSGPQVMDSYLNSPKETDNVLRTIDEKIWMFTGDIGLLNEEGYLKICDRSKDMLIVGGYKVFSVELEEKFLEIPFVSSCAVVGFKDEKRPGNDIVQLFVQCDDDRNISKEEKQKQITEFSDENLSPYKRPKGIHFLKMMPLTSVGKVDKRALRNV